MRRLLLLLAAFSLLSLGAVASGCNTNGGDEDETTTEEVDGGIEDDADEGADADEADSEGEAASVEFTAPEEGAAVDGPDVETQVEVEGFEVAAKMDEPNVEGEGHIHWIVDSGTPTPSAETTFTAEGLEAGEHTVKAELHENQHQPLDPPVETELSFTID